METLTHSAGAASLWLQHCNIDRALNVQNKDEYCFIWSILTAKYPMEVHPERLTHYNNYFDEFDITNLSFPLSICNIPKFESLNPNNAIVVTIINHHEFKASRYPTFLLFFHFSIYCIMPGLQPVFSACFVVSSIHSTCTCG